MASSSLVGATLNLLREIVPRLFSHAQLAHNHLGRQVEDVDPDGKSNPIHHGSKSSPSNVATE